MRRVERKWSGVDGLTTLPRDEEVAALESRELLQEGGDSLVVLYRRVRVVAVTVAALKAPHPHTGITVGKASAHGAFEHEEVRPFGPAKGIAEGPRNVEGSAVVVDEGETEE